jgi:hypothetical protein
MYVTGNLPRRSLGTTLRFERAETAVELGSAIAECVAVMHGACGLESLIVRTHIDAFPLVPNKVNQCVDLVRVEYGRTYTGEQTRARYETKKNPSGSYDWSRNAAIFDGLEHGRFLINFI